MGEHSKIEWCDHTFNPFIGCSKVSEGCANCYAEADMDKRRGRAKWGPDGTRSVTSYANWREPLKWDRAAKAAGKRARVFCASLADVLEDWDGQMVDCHGEPLFWNTMHEPEHSMGHDVEMTPHWHTLSGDVPVTMNHVRDELWALIRRTPNLQWMLLTKRPENAVRMIPADVLRLIWLGASVENQKAADARIPHLLAVDAAVRFLSCEPLLGPVDLGLWMTTHRCGDCEARGNETGDDKCPKCDSENYAPRTHFLWGEESWEESESRLESGRHCPIDWVIVGGESGEHARPMHPKWARALRDQCLAAGVPFFFKQWGEFNPHAHVPGFSRLLHVWPDGRFCKYAELGQPGLTNAPERVTTARVGKKAAGRILDGRTWDEFPVAEASRA